MRYGQKGGDGPTAGKKATTFIVTLPDGSEASKRDFNPPINPTGYAYQHNGCWYVAGVSGPNDHRFKGAYTQCPARRKTP
jgi:hypothetical protein